LICRTAEGNPFFTEEIARSLIETHTSALSTGRYIFAPLLTELAAPDTVQDVIRARLDRLPERLKRVLQMASVIGREFTLPLLDRLVTADDRLDESLRALKTTGLIYERSLYPELTYTFKHALTHEVVYTSLLPGSRRRMHLAVADAIEALYGD